MKKKKLVPRESRAAKAPQAAKVAPRPVNILRKSGSPVTRHKSVNVVK